MHKRSASKTSLFLLGIILLLGCLSTLHVAQEAGGDKMGAISVPRLQYQDRQQTVPLPVALLLQDSLPLQDSLRPRSLGTSFAVAEGDMEWNRTYGGAGAEAAFVVIQTADGGFAIAGWTDSYGAGDNDIWLVKTDVHGEMEWQQTYGGAGFETAWAVIQTADGGFALAGGTTSYGAGSEDFWLVKTDAQGEMEWQQTYGGAGFEAAWAMIQTADGGFALAGKTGVEEGLNDIWLVKTDANGTMEWQQTYGGAGTEVTWAVIQTVDGGFALAGLTASYGAGGEDFWLVKTDAQGGMEWQQTYGGTGFEAAWAMIQTADGGFALAGRTHSYGAGGSDAWLVKTDANGNMEWQQTYGGSDDDGAHSVIPTADSGFALAGLTASYGAGGEDFWLVKTYSNGTLQWNQTYGGSNTDRAWAGIQTADGSFAIAGLTASYGVGGEDFWLVKTIPLDTTPPVVTLMSPQNTTYATSMIPVYATNTTEPVHSARWRYWNSVWSVNQTLLWDESEGRWAAEGLTWLDGSYQVQVFFKDSVGNTAVASEWFTVDTTPPTVTPAITVLSPNGGEYWNGTQTINWTATDPQADPLTYTIYYSLNGGQTWIQLAARLTETSYQWDTTTDENGTNCLIQVEASDGTHTGVDVSDTSFEIANEPTNTAPIVYVIQPNGGEQVNGTYEIQWSANDPDGDVLKFNISYSPNEGQTWTQLATGVTKPSYTWDTTTVVNGTSYLIQVEANDGTYTEVDVSDKPFEIANEPIPFATQPVKTQSSMNIAVAAAAISGVVLVGAAAKAASIPPPLPGMRSRKDFLKRIIWYLLYPFIWLFGHIVYPPVCRRLTKADVTMNSTRQAILHLLQERGVAYLREIERTIDSGFFGLMWHLQVLEDFDYIRQMRIGKYRVYYLKGYGSSIPPSVELSFLFKNNNTRAIINYINDNPGTYQAEIARAVDLHHTTVRYYLLQMKEQKLFESFSDGRRTRYFLLDEKRPQVDEILQHVQPEGA